MKEKQNERNKVKNGVIFRVNRPGKEKEKEKICGE